MIERIGLSKSRYCRGVQCPKILWMDRYRHEEALNNPENVVFMNGTRVGELARGYFGEYVLVDLNENKTEMCERTRSFIESGRENIAEASFLYDGLYCAVDILHRNGDGWDIVEVKSSTHVRDIYIHDMAFQYYVLTKCGIRVKGIYNLHIDKTYIFHNQLNLKELFVLKDYTEICMELFDETETRIASLREYLNTKEEPLKEPDNCCETPYKCAYWNYCHKQLPCPSVFDIRGLDAKKKYMLYHQGIVSFEDIISRKPKLSKVQMMQVEASYYNKPDQVDTDAVRNFISTLSYPVYHLDFESFQPAVPKWEGCHPYEQIPFQYSLHIEHKDGLLQHKEFLAKEGTDPRRALAESLCRDIPPDSCSLAYNMSFERSIIFKLAELFPDLRNHLRNIGENLHDLMIPFQKHSYYNRDMHGSYSIKNVLPALFPDDPELDYHNLQQVHEGAEASAAFDMMEYLEPEEIQSLRENLLKYCALDTYAMVKILGKLKEL